jgi:hypothetical protein
VLVPAAAQTGRTASESVRRTCKRKRRGAVAVAAAVARPFQQPVAVVWLSHAAGAAVPPPLHVAVAMFPGPEDSEAAALLLDVDSAGRVLLAAIMYRAWPLKWRLQQSRPPGSAGSCGLGPGLWPSQLGANLRG